MNNDKPKTVIIAKPAVIDKPKPYVRIGKVYKPKE
jgi:hypothetical protein